MKPKPIPVAVTIVKKPFCRYCHGTIHAVVANAGRRPGVDVHPWCAPNVSVQPPAKARP